MNASKNYRVIGAQCGPYPKGSVIPDFVLLQCGGAETHVANGMLEETTDAVNVTIVPPKQSDATANETATALVLDNDKLRKELDRANFDANDAREKFQDTQRKAEALTAELAEKVTEIGRLRGLLEQERDGREKAEAAHKELAEEARRLRSEVAVWKATTEKLAPPADDGDPPKPSETVLTESVEPATKRTDGFK